ncbi:phage tail tip lysozyme [Streptomyces sp. NPDC056061]|uniref:phage tail tip lysozyme n=1 Tax=Streptomyces sp. NPDC056061 TaxID=3345700 RepID=UPI0035E22FCE
MVSDKSKKQDESVRPGAPARKGAGPKSLPEGHGAKGRGYAKISAPAQPTTRGAPPSKPSAGGSSPAGAPAAAPARRGTKSLGGSTPPDASGARVAAKAVAKDAAATTGTTDMTGAAGGAGGVMKAAEGAAKGMDGAAANAAGGAAKKAVEGDGSSAARRNAGRYAGAAVSGAVAGAQAGAAAGGIGAVPGAVVGAAKNVGIEAGKDAIEGVSKVTGGGPAAEPADKRLGAGGTSYERTVQKDAEGLGSKAAKGVTIGSGAAVAPHAMGVVMAMALLNWLKSMFFAALAMLANAANAVWMLILNVVKAIGHAIAAPFLAIGSFIAKGAGVVLGVTVTAAMAPVAAAASGVVATVAAAALVGTVFGGVLNSTALTEDQVGKGRVNCVVNAGNRGAGADVPASGEANARVVYSVLRTWGMPEENIAGILGNWSQESGIDPTSVQTFPVGTYTMTPEKEAGSKNTDNGIGLGQWTFGRNSALRGYAGSKNIDWYTIEAQLAFMAEGDNPGDVAVFRDMLGNSQGSPAAAAVHFHENWERSADDAQGIAERTGDAQMWYAKMSGWTVDPSAVDGVEDIVGGIIDSIGTGIRTIFGNCENKDGAGPVSLKDGGMTMAEAQSFVDLFNEEGDKFLDDRYGPGGGPGSCGDNHAMNCVSLSTWFVNKYTTYQQYPVGNGIDTAYTIAADMGKKLSATPTPYSVGSGPGSGVAGHTFVVLGIQGDQVIVGEAGYCAFMGRVSVLSASQLAADGWMFVDMSDAMLPEDQVKTA